MPAPFVVLAPVLQTLGLAPGVPSAPTVAEDGTLEVQMIAPGTLEQVRAALMDPIERQRLFPGVQKVEVLARDGSCIDLRLTTEGMASSMVYDMRSCQTPQGWTDSLIASEDFEAMNASWQLHSTSEGVQVRYRLNVSLDLPIPRSLISGRQGRSMVTALERLARLIH